MSVTVVPFSMAVMVILHEGRLVDQISSKCNGRYPQPGKRSLEPIVSRKRTCVSPLFATANQKQQQRVKQQLCQKERMPREGEGIGGRGFFFFFSFSLFLSLSLSSLFSFALTFLPTDLLTAILCSLKLRPGCPCRIR